MGKKTKKTTWRNLPIEGSELCSDSEESHVTTATTTHHHPTARNKPYSAPLRSHHNNSHTHHYNNGRGDHTQQPSHQHHHTTTTQQHQQPYYAKVAYNSHHNNTSSVTSPAARKYPQHDSVKTTRSSSTTSENKITFNEDEYTRITTPRQDVLFKKGYLNKPKSYMTQTSTGNSTTSTGNSTGNGTPDHQSADGTEGTDLEYESPFYYPNHCVGRDGVYFFNGFEPYPVMVYNAPYCYPEFPASRSKRYSTDSMTESTSPNNEETSQDQSHSGGEVNYATPVYLTNNVAYPTCYYNDLSESNETVSTSQNPTEPRKIKKKRRRKISKPVNDETTSSDDYDSTEEPVTQIESRTVTESCPSVSETSASTETTTLTVTATSAAAAAIITTTASNETSISRIASDANTTTTTTTTTSDSPKEGDTTETTTTTPDSVSERIVAEEEDKVYELKADAKEFVPRAYHHTHHIIDPASIQFINLPPNFLPMLPDNLHPAFLPPPGIPLPNYHHHHHHPHHMHHHHMEGAPKILPNYFVPGLHHPPNNIYEYVPNKTTVPVTSAATATVEESKDDDDDDVKEVVAEPKVEELAKEKVEEKVEEVVSVIEAVEDVVEIVNVIEPEVSEVILPQQSTEPKNNLSKDEIEEIVSKLEEAAKEQRINESSKRQQNNSRYTKSYQKSKYNNSKAAGGEATNGDIKQYNGGDRSKFSPNRRSFNNNYRKPESREEVKTSKDDSLGLDKVSKTLEQSTPTKQYSILFKDPVTPKIKTTTTPNPNNASVKVATTNSDRNCSSPSQSPSMKALVKYSESVKVAAEPVKLVTNNKVVASKTVVNGGTPPSSPKVQQKPSQWIPVSNRKKRRGNKNMSEEVELDEVGGEFKTSDEFEEYDVEKLVDVVPVESKVVKKEQVVNKQADVVKKIVEKVEEVVEKVEEVEEVVEVIDNIEVVVEPQEAIVEVPNVIIPVVESCQDVLVIHDVQELERVLLEESLKTSMLEKLEESSPFIEKSNNRKRGKKGTSGKPLQRRVMITDKIEIEVEPLTITEIIETPEKVANSKQEATKKVTASVESKAPEVEPLPIVPEAGPVEETPDRKKSKNKKKKSKTVANSNGVIASSMSNSSSSTTLNNGLDDSYDFLLGGVASSVDAEEKTNVEISQELDMLIQRGMYSSLEEKIRSFNITASNDGFFKTINYYGTGKLTEPNLSGKTAEDFGVKTTKPTTTLPKIGEKKIDFTQLKMKHPQLQMQEELLGKVSCDTEPSTSAGYRDFLGQGPNLNEPDKVDGDSEQSVESCEESTGKYPITKAVKEWMSKTREHTPEVEILKSPSTIYREFNELETSTESSESLPSEVLREELKEPKLAVNDLKKVLQDNEDEVTIFSASDNWTVSNHNSFDEDLLDCWDNELPGKTQLGVEITEVNGATTLMVQNGDITTPNGDSKAQALLNGLVTIPLAKVEQGEDVVEIYESKYGNNEDYRKIKEEIEASAGGGSCKSTGGASAAANNTLPRHGNLPYRAICCAIM